jgi:tetratricopeptide (TPR) repeat protein
VHCKRDTCSPVASGCKEGQHLLYDAGGPLNNPLVHIHLNNSPPLAMTRVTLLRALLVLLLLHAACADRFNDLVKKGNSAANQQRHSEALAFFTEALALQPANLPVLRTSADIAHALGQTKEAMELMLRIIGINGQDKDHKTWSDLSDMLASGGDYGRAATCIDNAIKIKPKKALYHFKKGNYFHALGDDITSVKAHNEAVRIKPTYFEAWNNLGTSYMSLTEFQNAITVLRKALELVPGHVTPLFNLALMETRTCDWSQTSERRKSLSGALEGAVKSGNHLVIPFHAFEFGYTPQEIKTLSRLYTDSAVLRPIKHLLPGHDFKNKLPTLADGSKLVVAYLSATGFQVGCAARRPRFVPTRALAPGVCNDCARPAFLLWAARQGQVRRCMLQRPPWRQQPRAQQHCGRLQQGHD